MRIPKILIALFFIFIIKGGIVLITGNFTNFMKMGGIFFKKIIGGEILPSTKPLIYNLSYLIIHLKIAPVGMNGRGHRIFRMKNKTETTGKEIYITYLKILLHRWSQRAKNGGNIDSSFFKNLPILNNTGPSATTFFPVP